MEVMETTEELQRLNQEWQAARWRLPEQPEGQARSCQIDGCLRMPFVRIRLLHRQATLCFTHFQRLETIAGAAAAAQAEAGAPVSQ